MSWQIVCLKLLGPWLSLIGPWLWSSSALGASVSQIDCTRRPIEQIPPGTKVGNRPPVGWTHLIFKTRNRLATGDVDSIPEFGRAAGEFLFTVFAARVAPADPTGRAPWRLEKVAMAVGAQVGQEDIVLTSATQKELGADLGVLKLAILGRAEEHLKKVHQVAFSPRLAMVDAPTYFADPDAHRPIVIRYLLLVRPEDGGLATLAWRIDLDQDGRYIAARSPAVLIQPNLVAITPLHVDGKKVTLGIPAPEALATTRLPRGREVPIPLVVQAVAGRQDLSPQDVLFLETHFRQALENLSPLPQLLPKQ
ncbi:MAG: hypothetical protein NZ602_00405 [Thermoguttaceae bacterium]|nr:hypothetical protein [Thermoguttaceae bacterium]MDW8037026.1 hypothetical protein [Thermoguttaceae bacterium]